MLRPSPQKSLGDNNKMRLNFRVARRRFFFAAKTSIVHMDGVPNSRSQGLYGLRTVVIEKLSLHLRYEAGPIVNHQLNKLGASIALAWR